MTKQRLQAICDEVARSSNGLPTLQQWLDWLGTVPELQPLLEGIYCGRDGRATSDELLQGRSLNVGWHNWRVEFAYLL